MPRLSEYEREAPSLDAAAIIARGHQADLLREAEHSRLLKVARMCKAVFCRVFG